MNATTTTMFPRSVHEKYLGVVQLSRTIEGYVKPLLEKKTQLEIERFNHVTLNRKPTGFSLAQFEMLRGEIAPNRVDVTSWPDLLDLEEGRPVPERTTGRR